jgi:hypothetical protein
MLGALTQQMKNMNLHSPRPVRPFSNLSLSSILATIRCFDSPPLYLPKEHISDYSLDYSLDYSVRQPKDDVWVLQKDTFLSSNRERKRERKHRNLLDPEDHRDDKSPDSTPKELTVHSCRLKDLLEPEIDLLEARVLTLDLGL